MRTTKISAKEEDDVMKFRKLAALCLAALCLMTLAACGGKPAQGASSDGVRRMAYVASVRDEYLSKLEEAAIEAAAEGGVFFRFFSILFLPKLFEKVLQSPAGILYNVG